MASGTNTASHEDAFNLLCGDKIGEGIHRTVFACNLLPHLVVKVENADFRYFANVHEMKFWSDFEHDKAVGKWLAPCTHLSLDGRILLQYRCDPVPQSFDMPQQMPAFLTDLKRCNFGLFEGRLVCVDYAMVIPGASARLKRAYWS